MALTDTAGLHTEPIPAPDEAVDPVDERSLTLQALAWDAQAIHARLAALLQATGAALAVVAELVEIAEGLS